ncbi:signal peptidase I [Microbacterium ulmi]|uniref:Signal peptidase I n=1 Tax=Microbacterium ulmi TaxID=179095 RepID=A0A7Y2PZ11_9MICO|nr:signal peptidase I [Microbacterium ulmi]NII70796.1 signal peptidase [Microbacterium ulmi]NNH02813.1 signal peptidase I [Microbacterium ulmi]
MTTAPLEVTTLPVRTATSEVEPARRTFADRHPILHSLWYGISAGMLGLVLLIAVLTIIVPKVVGGVPLTVLSPSMQPTLPVGTLLIVRPVTPEELRIGDVVSFQPYPLDPTLVTHRVVGITQHQDGTFVFTTQGDANATVDDPVYGKQVRAVLMYSIPLLGWVSNWVNVQHKHWIVPTAAGALFAYGGYTIVSAAVAKKRERDAEKDRLAEDACAMEPRETA